MDPSRPKAEELHGLRQFLKALETPGTIISRNGVDVTRQEIAILRREIAYLEDAFARPIPGGRYS
jgi:hypothetical protein